MTMIPSENVFASSLYLKSNPAIVLLHSFKYSIVSHRVQSAEFILVCILLKLTLVMGFCNTSISSSDTWFLEIPIFEHDPCVYIQN